MLLPNAERAEIDPEKLRSYLLSTTHPHGQFKARFFGALGYSAERWLELEADLRLQHLTQEAQLSRVTAYGQSFTIRAILRGPSGESAVLVSVWLVEAGGTVPQFITAYPGGKL